jgi:predicted dehydrogenase
MAALKTALIGAGRRTRGVYARFLPRLREQVEIVAVCDPLAESADAAAARYGARAFRSIRDLVAARCAEAAIVVTPVESHHAVSVYLSRHGIHHAVETSMATTLTQCRDMARQAEAAGVVLHVNEQFFRREVIAFARQIVAAGVIGDVQRITGYHGHTGYHNNSIWQGLAGGPPAAVNAVEHTMRVHRHLDGASRWQDAETFRLRVMHFDGGLLITDMAANIKSALGRYPRPGYLEIDGTRGTIVEQSNGRPAPWESAAEVRLVAEQDYACGAYADSFPIERVTMVGHRVNVSRRLPHNCEYHYLRVRLPEGVLAYENPMLNLGITNNYDSTVAQSTMDFVRAVRGEGPREFTVEQAIASGEMEAAFAASAALGGARVRLPVPEQTDAERAALAALTGKYGVDPMDVEAMIDVAFPKNYVEDPGGRAVS